MNFDKDIQDNTTIFGKILRGEIPAEKLYEDDYVLAFKDIMPKARVHVLVIPKKCIQDLRVAGPEDAEILGHMMCKISEIAKLAGLDKGGFRIISNNGEHSGQEVPHLHLHLLGGEFLPKF
tara:strand:+ start:125536 stop:125898 length:363 start_codon:yes stop_codon:yes gene_type:complete